MIGAIVGGIASQAIGKIASNAIGNIMGGGGQEGASGMSKAELEEQHKKSMEEQYAMMALQDKMAHDNTMAQMISNIQKSEIDTLKGIAANMK